MEVFTAVVEAGSFAEAARRLEVSPSGVTRAVSALERRLGVRLLQRTTRSLNLTEPGMRFHRSAGRVVAAALTAEAEITGRCSPRGPLSVAASTSLGRVVVASALGAFLGIHPEVVGTLTLSDRVANLAEEGIDVAVRVGPLAEAGPFARRVGAVGRTLVASPAYLAQRAPPEEPRALREHAIIAFAGLMPGRNLPFGSGPVRLAPRLEVDDAAAAIALAEAGHGIAPAPSFMVRDALAQGRLVEVLAPHAPPPRPVHLVFPTGRLIGATARAFADHAAPRLAAALS